MDETQLNAAQQQVVGPLEENNALIILKADEAEPATVLANNGSDGQIIRNRGALSFRLGDFFSGNDTEQMRLTEEGNLGIGTENPRTKLDVAGTIHATKGIEFDDGTVQTTGLSGRKDKDWQRYSQCQWCSVHKTELLSGPTAPARWETRCWARSEPALNCAPPHRAWASIRFSSTPVLIRASRSCRLIPSLDQTPIYRSR